MIYSNLATAIKECSRYKVLVVEGHRCSGKDFFIQTLMEKNPEFFHYEICRPRKQYKLPCGSIKIPDKLNLKQGVYWCLDVFRQLVHNNTQIKVVINRSLLSNFAFEGEDDEMRDLWLDALRRCSGHLILLRPSDELAMERIQSADRKSEVVSIFHERARMDELFEAFGDSMTSVLAERIIS